MRHVKTTANIKRQVMSNAWYIFKMRVYKVKTFAGALRKAWANMQRKVIDYVIDGLDPNIELNRPLLDTCSIVGVPAGYYGVSGRYYGD